MLKTATVEAWTASATRSIEVSKFPIENKDGLSYIRRLFFWSDYTTVTTGAGGATTPIELHDLISSVDLQGAGDYYGPKGISGHDMSALYTALSGQHLAENVDAEADENVPASTTGAERQVLDVFAYDVIGAAPADTMPLAKFLGSIGAKLQWRYSALPTNATTVTGNNHVVVETEEVDELRAVPAVVVEKAGVDRLTNGSISGGKLVAMLLKRSSDLTDSLITGFKLWADGNQLADLSTEPGFINQMVFEGAGNAVAASGANQQESGFDSLSGTRPRFMQLFPFRRHQDDRRLSKRPNAALFTFTLEPSTLTASQYEILSVVLHRVHALTAAKQVSTCACDYPRILEVGAKSPDAVFHPKTVSKVAGVDDRHRGYFAMKLDPSFRK